MIPKLPTEPKKKKNDDDEDQAWKELLFLNWEYMLKTKNFYFKRI